jgi:hypothetical protein
MSDTGDTGGRDTGGNPEDTGGIEDTGAAPDDESGGGTVEAGPPDEVILIDDGREIDVTNHPDDAFPPGSQVPDQSASTAAGGGGGKPRIVRATVSNETVATTAIRPRSRG